MKNIEAENGSFKNMLRIFPRMQAFGWEYFKVDIKIRSTFLKARMTYDWARVRSEAIVKLLVARIFAQNIPGWLDEKSIQTRKAIFLLK